MIYNSDAGHIKYTNIQYLVSLIVPLIIDFYNSSQTWKNFGFLSKPQKRSMINSIFNGKKHDKERFLKRELLISMISLSFYHIYNLKFGENGWNVGTDGKLLYDFDKHSERGPLIISNHWGNVEGRILDNIYVLDCFISEFTSYGLNIFEECDITDYDINETSARYQVLSYVCNYLINVIVAKYNSLSFDVICTAVFLKYLNERFVKLDNTEYVHIFFNTVSVKLFDVLSDFKNIRINFSPYSDELGHCYIRF